jgi:S1-C subfamily serine protease
VYATVNPSVVNIRVVGQAGGGSLRSLTEGLGSGFVWDKQGHIVTNNHVVEDATRITVTFADGAVATATVLATDPDSDLAVVKVNVPEDKLQPVTLADSSAVRVGQLAIAIGNPFGLQGTMTAGIVSALGRSLPVDSQGTLTGSFSIPDVIQTDAPINPGNSGGVLLDVNGRLIGVPSAIISSTQSAGGIGFAIQASMVQKVVTALIENGVYEHPWLGVTVTTLDPDVAEAMDLNPAQTGALVQEVTADSPADKAGLRAGGRTMMLGGRSIAIGGDVIIAVNGQGVRGSDGLIALLGQTQVGETVTMTVLRDGGQRDLSVTLAARPRQNANTGGGAGQTEETVYLGVSTVTVTPEIAAAASLPADTKGVLVQQVLRGSPAEDAGLRAGTTAATVDGQAILIGGDVITAVDGKPVATTVELRAAIVAHKAGDQATVTFLRDGAEQTVTATLAERP